MKIKSIMIRSLIGAIVGLFSSTSFAYEPMSILTVQVNGFTNNSGVARIAVFNTADAFTKDNTSGALASEKCATKIKNQVARCVFKTPYGIYAIKVFHDIDNSGRLKTSFFGIPKEQYGFSNNPSHQTGSRPWGDAKFTIDTPKALQTITLVGSE